MPFHKPKKHSLLDSTELVGLSKGKFYLVYEDKGERHLYTRFLKSGFHHVTAYKFTGIFWLKLDFSLGFSEFDILPYDWHDTISDVLEGQNVAHQYVEVWRRPRYRVRSILAPWTCVEAMKSLLGIRAWWVFTPWQLYKHMEKHYG